MKKWLILVIVTAPAGFIYSQSKNVHDTMNLKFARNNPYPNQLSFDVLPILSGGLSTTFAFQHKIGWGQFVRKDRSYYYNISITLNNQVPVTNKILADTSSGIPNIAVFQNNYVHSSTNNVISLGAGVAYNLDRFQLQYGAGIIAGFQKQTNYAWGIAKGFPEEFDTLSSHTWFIGIEPTLSIRFFIAARFAVSLSGSIPIRYLVERSTTTVSKGGETNGEAIKFSYVTVNTIPFRTLAIEFHF